MKTISIQDEALHQVLSGLRLSGCLYFCSDFCGDWGMRMGQSSFAQYHYVAQGECLLEMGENNIYLHSGDVVILISGQAHSLKSKPGVKPVNGTELLQSLRCGKPLFQKGEPKTQLLCGHFEFDQHGGHPLVTSLPEVILIRKEQHKDADWLNSMMPLLLSENEVQKNHQVINRLAEALFVKLLHAYIQQDNLKKGFLAAIEDKRIAKALKLMHTQMQDNLSIEQIAQQVGMSRSAFAALFKSLLEQSPMEYLTHWRLQRSRQLLKTSGKTLQQISEEVGYGSEASFNHAFKRIYHLAPGEYRAQTAS